MTTHPTAKLEADPSLAIEFGPMLLDRQSRSSGLTKLAGGFAEFTSDVPSEPATLAFEELILVLAGNIRLTIDNMPVTGTVGDILALEEGSTVVYAGTPGSRIFYVVTPADWDKQ